jgi:uncharacterized sporulation protein YeaH/YhbH (DUF444 family)
VNIIDRRLNPQGKSLTNRQRFLRRARRRIQEAVREAARGRGIADIADGEKISIPADDLREPVFRRGQDGGVRDYVLPGNKEYLRGDKLPRPESGGGQGGGSEGSPDGEGEDDFRFVLTKEEFLDIFLDDLELPDLVKKQVQKSESHTFTRAGFSVTGNPSSLAIIRTMRNSLSRRLALRRPTLEELQELEAKITALRQRGEDADELAKLEADLERITRRRKIIPFIDPLDVRFKRFEPVPKPITQAVMFCLMDVSGSMTEHMKDLAKRFFMLLYLFLTRRYRHVDIVFIRHTHEASEVDEQTFFYSTDSGGTVVSTALSEMKKIIAERYPTANWNIYAAQASDGDNTSSDNDVATKLLQEAILPLCQYFAYVEVGPEDKDWTSRNTDLWTTYKGVNNPHGILAMRKVRRRNEIYPVFHDLFAREKATR